MPTYQYACTDCGHAFDQFQSFSDDALTSCPECTGRLRKIFNAVGVVFKGSGFYRNDSRGKESTSDAAKSSSSSASGSAGSGEKSAATTESKPAAAASAPSTSSSSASSSSSSSSSD